ncbi:tetratricopeptide repeat protein [Aurantiacibacter suaedae]|uniref:tetratricopeptide repeat protein n=1 Tax=Aurantiacibacter suaedae TaxID=2545755 RepID=UPI001F4FC4EC|nr:tetratricopeptide repeat protein [Aurantiacibacter suaedae]
MIQQIARARRGLMMSSAVALAMVVSTPAAAQADARLERIEAQLRALQRTVFPGGDERFFEPEITPQASNANTPTPGVSSSALTDVLSRISAIESQLTRLTAATEVNQNALSALEQKVAAMEARGAVASTPSPAQLQTPTPMPATTPETRAATTPTPTPAPAPSANPNQPSGVIAVPGSAQAGPSAERLAGVQSISKPATGDMGEDEYTYGFRLWDAKFFPEAQQQLALYIERYPNHRMISYGRNLLGRAYLDAGDPRSAATQFFDNYQSDKQGARAGDSLLYLAESMIQLEDTRRACIALSEFGDTYPALATGRLQSMYDALKGRVSCN